MAKAMTKRNILFLGDHPLSTSGVGTQSRWIIQGLINTGKYSFKCFGGAMKHDNYDVVKVNDDFIIKPTNGFGDANLIRQTLVTEKPDAVFLFTDPRFFLWLWEIEDEVHQVCPIVYNTLWDNGPRPVFNDVLYDSTDLINCINHPTYEMVSEKFAERTNYIPHAVPADLFFPIPDTDRLRAKETILGKDRIDHFIILYVGRNARRKCPSDILSAFKVFQNGLHRDFGHRKATLVMHTEPLDPEGPNLLQVIEMLGIKNDVVFSKERVGFPDMNTLYNVSDVLVNWSCAEGFGLPVLEAKMCGKPVIAMKTGGLTRQVVDHETGVHYGVGVDPEVRTLVGNQQVPYIYEDFASHATLAKAYRTVFDMGHEERVRLGVAARAHALKHYDMGRMIDAWDRTLEDTIVKWKAGQLPNNKRWEETTL